MITNTPKPPYIAAIFTSIRTDIEDGYKQMNELTLKELKAVEGYLGHESFRNKKGFGINVSYWKDIDSLKNWRDNALHQEAQKLGKQKWYKNYKLRICSVERDYEFEK